MDLIHRINKLRSQIPATSHTYLSCFVCNLLDSSNIIISQLEAILLTMTDILPSSDYVDQTDMHQTVCSVQ